MALATFRLNFLPRLRDGRQIRRYRHHLLEGEALVGSQPLLPHLQRLPLQFQQVEGGPSMTLRDALRETPRLALIEPGSRSLAMRQLCLQWARGAQLPTAYVPLLYRVQQAANHSIQPLQLLHQQMEQLGFAINELVVKRGLAAGVWLLLIEGWDQLKPNEQQRWSTWISAWLERYPALSMMLATSKPQTIPNQFALWHSVQWRG
ncbi:NACHT domain-containing protein [Herpetosiphon sp. NSE202]|uniref:NACHT domain-containing protein n=1 Tax=Herpetosiphon sp. NSE202 TaxID=3351349 RepID=UPI00362AACD2